VPEAVDEEPPTDEARDTPEGFPDDDVPVDAVPDALAPDAIAAPDEEAVPDELPTVRGAQVPLLHTSSARQSALALHERSSVTVEVHAAVRSSAHAAAQRGVG
jgi:hypothetical protein